MKKEKTLKVITAGLTLAIMALSASATITYKTCMADSTHASAVIESDVDADLGTSAYISTFLDTATGTTQTTPRRSASYCSASMLEEWPDDPVLKSSSWVYVGDVLVDYAVWNK